MAPVGIAVVVRGFAAAVALFALHAAWYADLFYLTEFRDWLLWPLTGDEVLAMARNLLTCEDSCSRSVGLLLARGLGTCCVDEPRLVNLVLLTLAPLTAWLLYLFVVALGGGERPAAAAVLLWGVSLPVRDCIGWQATVHDRVGGVFVMLALLTLVAFLRRQRPRWPATVAANVLLTAWTALAFHSKEATWMLPSVCLALVWFVGPKAVPLRRRSQLLVVPLIYCAHYFVAWWRGGGAGEVHAFAGDRLRNFVHHCETLTDPIGGGWPLVLALLAMATAVAIADVRARSPVVVALVGFVVAFLLPLSARHDSMYYMYLPGGFLLVAVFVALSRCARGSVANGVLTAVAIAIAVWSMCRGADQAAAAQRFSTGLRDAREQLRDLLPASPPQRLRFAIPPGMHNWIRGSGAGIACHLLARDPGGDWPAQVDIEPIDARDPLPTGEWRIAFTADGDLAGVWNGPQRLR